jgi:Flp pilus assembly pilin Flp
MVAVYRIDGARETITTPRELKTEHWWYDFDSIFATKKVNGGMMEALYLGMKYLSHDESGTSAVEYSILVSCIAIAIISAVALFGSLVKELFVKGDEIFK